MESVRQEPTECEHVWSDGWEFRFKKFKMHKYWIKELVKEVSDRFKYCDKCGAFNITDVISKGHGTSSSPLHHDNDNTTATTST